MKYALAGILICFSLAAQPPAKVCRQWDIEVGHKIVVPCPPPKPSRLKAAAVKAHHVLHVAGEVVIGAAIVGVYVYSQQR